MSSVPNASYQAALARSSEIEGQIKEGPEKFRVLTGDRPTGRLHVGHYFGSLQNRVRLQDFGVPVMVLIADYQVITDRDGSAGTSQFIPEMLLDYMAIGIDPSKATILAQSAVPELNQLLLPFLSLVSIGELERNPTVKDEIRAANRPAVSGLMFTYPVHQAADILFCKANVVPVGKDQLPHLEITRTIAKRFNELYCGGQEFFPIPDALLSSAPALLGTDGRKMSKSFGNSIQIGMTEDETANLLKKAKTDSERQITFDPENRPEVSSLLTLAGLCVDREPVDIADELGDGGGAALKAFVTDAVNGYFAPIRERRKELAKDMKVVHQALVDGNEQAREAGRQTLRGVREAMDMNYDDASF